MEIYTVDYIPNRDYRVVGLVRGNVVQSKNYFTDAGAAWKTIIGGEIRGYSDMLAQARQIATDRMIAQAKEIGANGIIGIKYSISNIYQICHILKFITLSK